MQREGLDRRSAHDLLNDLLALARNDKHTVIYTISEPRSDVFGLFDRLVFLAGGQMIYSGRTRDLQQYLADNDHVCPPGYSVFDYLGRCY